MIQVEGVFRALLRERGKIVPGSRREGRNVVTTEGREFLSKRAGASDAGGTLIDSRFVQYIGMGLGTQLEVPEVVAMVNGARTFDGGNYIKQIVLPPTFPAVGTVRFALTFEDDDITFGGVPTAELTEAGLFLSDATPAQNGETVCAYKTFEKLTKTPSFSLDVEWEWRF